MRLAAWSIILEEVHAKARFDIHFVIDHFKKAACAYFGEKEYLKISWEEYEDFPSLHEEHPLVITNFDDLEKFKPWNVDDHPLRDIIGVDDLVKFKLWNVTIERLSGKEKDDYLRRMILFCFWCGEQLPLRLLICFQCKFHYSYSCGVFSDFLGRIHVSCFSDRSRRESEDSDSDDESEVSIGELEEVSSKERPTDQTHPTVVLCLFCNTMADMDLYELADIQGYHWSGPSL